MCMIRIVFSEMCWEIHGTFVLKTPIYDECQIQVNNKVFGTATGMGWAQQRYPQMESMIEPLTPFRGNSSASQNLISGQKFCPEILACLSGQNFWPDISKTLF